MERVVGLTAGPTGPSEQIAGIISTHEAALLRYASRLLNNHAAAQDVVQNVFIRLCQKWKDGFQPSSHLRNWLYRVTHNEALDHIRRETRRRSLHENAVQEIMINHSARATPEAERRELVLAALKTLHPREQQVVLLRLEEGLSYTEIAAITGRSIGNVGNILHHAVLKLAQIVEKEMTSRGGV